MHVRRARLAVVASVAALTTLSLAGPALAQEDADFDIQKAVDDAEPGDTIHIPSGTYEQNVTITKDEISLRGDGDVVLRSDNPKPTKCDDGNTARVSGICIFGEVRFPPEDDPDGEPIEVLDAVEDVSISGITVEGFSGDGLVALGTEDLRVRNSRFEDNKGYGAASFVTHETTFRGNSAVGNDEAGFYVGASPDSQSDVRGNYSADNELGFFFRHASNGEARDNVAEDNCIGLLILADVPGPARDWTVRDNEVNDNNRVCPPVGQEIPALSGAGIVLSGAQDIRVRDNTVRDNDSTADSAFNGGIVAVVGFGGTVPSDITLEGNRAFDNDPFDIDVDAARNVDSDDNRCERSEPADICD
jgi:hypothetical protein